MTGLNPRRRSAPTTDSSAARAPEGSQPQAGSYVICGNTLLLDALYLYQPRSGALRCRDAAACQGQALRAATLPQLEMDQGGLTSDVLRHAIRAQGPSFG